MRPRGSGAPNGASETERFHGPPAPVAGEVAPPRNSPGSLPESSHESAPESPPQNAANDDASLGRYLSRQRRMRGISIEELSELTKIPVRSLERLEAGRFDGQADGFVRGFVRTVADGLGLDPEDTVARMLSEVRIDDERGIVRGAILRRAVLAALLLVIGGAVLGVTHLATRPSAATDVADGEVRLRYRRDPVRALADAAAAVRPETAADAESARPGAWPAGPRTGERVAVTGPIESAPH